ncbi:polysaccharide biosynthesis protein [Halobacillus litoralis]|uniref:polysaccharide biosynthesis protein n=1 Tax=Halobacillus litoralis TaxID=45668 RepID=UPI001CFE15CA|nr:nucleoside-diphosphate sugar epimerase/dehydratase [Halobacillus litoralis]
MSIQKRFYSLSLLDSLIVLCSFYSTLLLVFPISQVFTTSLLVVASALVISHYIFAHKYNLYKRAWEFASTGEMILIVKAVTYSVLTAALLQFIMIQEIYLRLFVFIWMMQFFLISGSRFSWRILRDKQKEKKRLRDKRTLIIGAGSAGTLLARQLNQSSECDLKPVAFVDDDKQKQYLDILCIPVVGGIDSLQQIVVQHKIESIIIAIPSLNKIELNRIYGECKKTNVKTQMLPMIEDLVTGKVSVNDIQDVEVDDLLGRKPINLDIQSIESMVTNRVVLITGAGGSIGSEICRQVIQFSPSTIVLLGHGENSIYSIEKELKSLAEGDIKLITEIADIKDRDRMFSIMNIYNPGVVFHAAAHKHVPLMEKNPAEAVHNNIFGTKNVAEAASSAGVETFVMISTDKAVNPTSVMGATKRVAEMVIQELNNESITRFVAVRFGNVLGSRGSVIPLFKEQVKKGGPVTVTHPEMQRYFMTIPEASKLVLQAAALATGGEIFVLDMGKPVKILDLAKNLIKLSGLTENEIEIQFTGIRPGEKLYEELLNEYEIQNEQIHPKIYVGSSIEVHTEEILNNIHELSSVNGEGLRELLLSITNPVQEDENEKVNRTVLV